jgi:hypothetical protein
MAPAALTASQLVIGARPTRSSISLMFGEFANAALFLAFDESSLMKGCDMVADAGAHSGAASWPERISMLLRLW